SNEPTPPRDCRGKRNSYTHHCEFLAPLECRASGLALLRSSAAILQRAPRMPNNFPRVGTGNRSRIMAAAAYRMRGEHGEFIGHPNHQGSSERTSLFESARSK